MMDRHNWFSRAFGKNGMDERQTYLSGRMYKHVAVYLSVLTLANGLLADSGVVWADGFMASLLILYAAYMAGVVEKAFQGIIDYGRKATKRLIALMSVAAVVMIAYSLRPGQGAGWLVEDGMLGASGCLLAMGIMMGAAAACMLARRRAELNRA
ncbi:MAG: hypothetical protein LBH66_05275 [Oscillospiraceae bacterium]|jgi:hypothetical protein|nr:hypothetical protein [Oscillospiraceae bacterium]